MFGAVNIPGVTQTELDEKIGEIVVAILRGGAVSTWLETRAGEVIQTRDGTDISAVAIWNV